MSKQIVSVDEVKKALNIDSFRNLSKDKIMEFDVSSATVELAAKALNCEPCRIAKTLSFLVGEQPILILTAGDVKVDNNINNNKYFLICPHVPFRQLYKLAY